MDFSFTTEITRELRKIKRKHPTRFTKIQKQLRRFRENPRHPSLRTHKLKGNLESTWSVSIESNMRFIYFIKDNKAIFFKLGNHDKVYRK